MAKPLFTPEELAELAAYDAEIDKETITQHEIEESRLRDKMAIHDRKDKKTQKVADYQRAYREANKEKVAAQKRAYMRKRRSAACARSTRVPA